MKNITKFLLLFFIFTHLHAENFSKAFMEKVFEVRSEINKNNINEAVKILGKIKVSNENCNRKYY